VIHVKDAIARLVAHMKWADDRVLAALRARTTPEALRWFAHVVAVERVWHLRVRGEDWRTQKVWPEMTLDECAAMARANAAMLDEWVAALDAKELARAVTYTNSAGNTFSDSVGDILLHVALHGAHHRGQIAASLRAAGAAPPAVDYILLVRGG
jgi:uncharacterized damage-inducible protein DinB